jgi:general secretion pathway protein I
MARSTNPTAPTARTRRTARSGFTLLEVMIALALLGLGLTVLIKSAAGNIFNSQQAHMIGVVTDLARAKMYDLEDKQIKDGFTDTEQHEDDQTFSDEGWPSIHYSYKVELVELPSYDNLQAIMQGKGSGSSSSSGSGGGGSGGSGEGGGGGGFQDSLMGGLLSQFGGGLGGAGGMPGMGAGSGKGSGDIASALGGSFVQTYYTMFQQILKESVRKVTLTVSWQVMGSDRDMKVVSFITDAAAMDKVLSDIGKNDLDDANAAKGSGKGSNGGSNSGGGGGGSGSGRKTN